MATREHPGQPDQIDNCYNLIATKNWHLLDGMPVFMFLYTALYGYFVYVVIRHRTSRAQRCRHIEYALVARTSETETLVTLCLDERPIYQHVDLFQQGTLTRIHD